MTCQFHHLLGGGIRLSLATCQVIDFDTLESWSPAGSTAKARPAGRKEDVARNTSLHITSSGRGGHRSIHFTGSLCGQVRQSFSADQQNMTRVQGDVSTNTLFAQVFTSLGHFCMWGDFVQTTDRTEALVFAVVGVRGFRQTLGV